MLSMTILSSLEREQGFYPHRRQNKVDLNVFEEDTSFLTPDPWVEEMIQSERVSVHHSEKHPDMALLYQAG